MKKFVTSLLGLTLVLGMTSSAFAEETTAEKEISRAIKLNGYQIEVEPNNKRSSANELGFGRFGQLSTSDTVDYYKFTAYSSGSVTIELSGVPNHIPYRIIGDNFSPPGGGQYGSPNTGASRTITFPTVAGTTYTFTVDSDAGYDTSGNYYLVKLL
ncbi:hypothetical protein HPY31_28565 [Brevibacillus sp. HB1.3]|uniref:hypothetical protein n=1 Tax=Brevibacillus sp. HB1.3 TaxID=2738842 RepID=UPI001551F541|nr:hypothetical protein [Brevibacillus sp. HB1.3]NQF17822.1 hypothetical protein [Brevibacillus sp. HB1.3]